MDNVGLWFRVRCWAWRCLVPGLAALLAACGGGGGSAPAPVAAEVFTISGTVRSVADGQALAGVAVSAAGVTGTTAADGSYTLANVPWQARVAVRFDRSNHARGVVTVETASAAAARADARLVPVSAQQSLDAALATSVAAPGSTAQVSLPANALVNATTGAAVTGTVSAELTVIDPVRDPASMPGNYTAAPAAAGGAERTIESFGAIHFSLKDASGNALNLAAGRQATIRIPVSTRSADLPATIPLFHFNETTGLWVEEGSASLAGTAPNQYYEGTVSHFSYWNADRATETIFVRGCVRDTSDTPVQNVPVRSTGVDYTGQASALTTAQGSFRVAIRRGGVAAVQAELGDRKSNAVTVGPSQTDIELPTCLVLNGAPQPPLIVTQPQAQSVLPGGYAVFTVQALGSGVLRYQWQRGGVALPGATNASLVLTNVTTGDDGASFSVVVSNDAGSTPSQAAVLQVDTTPQPPLLLQQPQAAQVTVGGTATFQVRAQTRGGQLSFQWLRNGEAIPGATGTSHTTAAVQAGDDGALYSVRVRSDNGASVDSDTARLTVVTVITPPAIAQQPVSVSVGVGQAASFSVTATGSPTLLYQWRRNGVAIEGATGASYTTAATTLADNGAVFSVVVRNGGGDATSQGATLTVSQPTGQGGYHLVTQGGPMVQSTMTFADGVQTVFSQALLAVSASNPSAVPVTLAPAGQMGQLTAPMVQASIANGQVTDARTRFAVFFSDGRLLKVDQVVAGSATPVAQALSNVTSTQVCFEQGGGLFGFGVEGNDVADPARSWVFLKAPGTDGNCGNADDVVLAARLDMDAGTPPLTVPGEPLAAIRSANGGITGFIVRQGSAIRRTDANFANAGDLFTVAGDFANGPVVVLADFPGFWLFRDAGSLKAVNLANPGTRVTLATLNAGESLPLDGTVANGAMFLALPGAASTRVLRVDGALQATVFTTLTGNVDQLVATDTHLVGWRSNAVYSVPLTGGTPLTLFSEGQDQAPVQVAVGASTVAVELMTTGSATASNRLLLVNADGSNPQTLENTAVVAPVGPASEALSRVFSRARALIVAQGGVDVTNQAGATVSAIELDTRQVLQTYGTLPATPSGQLFSNFGQALQWGQPGLLSFLMTRFTEPFGVSTDLYFLDTDAAGLVRSTNFGVGQSVSPQAVPRPRPAAAARPAGAGGSWR